MHKAYELVVDRLIQAIERGLVPWRRPWTTPMNLVTGKLYRGINYLMLATCDHPDPRFLTYLQAEKLGGHVKRGERGYPVTKWRFPTDAELEQKPDAKPFVRSYTVFNLNQCEGLDNLPKLVALEHDSIVEAQAIIEGWADRPVIEHGGYRASYSPSKDLVRMPEMAKFRQVEAYYDTLFHELVHSTGHPSRLGRMVSPFVNRGQYCLEEMVAEIGGALLCSASGISNADLYDNNAAYIAGWLQAVRADRNMLIRAASMAARAADLIVGGIDKHEEVLGAEPGADLAVAA